MKKYLFFGMIGAMALTFNACSSDDAVEVGQTPELTGESVKTTFTISIPVADNATRMTSGAAQESNNFTGMSDIHLYPFAIASPYVVAGTDAIFAPISLADLASTALDQTGSSGDFHGKVYSDVEVPVGTSAFLFYGQKTDGQGGELTATYGNANTTVAAGIHFDLVPIQSDLTYDGENVNSNTDAAAIITALKAVTTAFDTQINQANTANETSVANMLTELKNLFNTNIAGSANSVKQLLTDLSTTLAGPDTYYDAVKTVVETQISNLSSNTFPNSIGLPDGAIGVKYDSTDDWAFDKTANPNGLGNPELDTYVKPAQLWYFLNTPISTDVTEHQTEYSSKSTWNDVVALYTEGNAVTANTRAIVLKNEIQYAVGRLDATVKIASGVTLKGRDGVDNSQTSGTEAGADITAPTGGYSFTVNGILIGGQKNVDWKFEPTGTDEFVIYDNAMTTSGATATTTASDVNYTLALETAADTGVKVVVELINDGDDFYGYNDQLIPNGSKFYLAATLTPSEGTGYSAGTLDKVFMQDYNTVVNFTIGETSLQNAYNVIPDLRSPKLELGLAVDLRWNSGLSFTPTFQ